MAVLTVDVGGSPVSVNCTRGGHAPPRRVGPKSAGNSGAEESSVRAELMVVPIITDPISLETAATLRTKFAIGNQVPCAGDIFNVPGTIVCSGTITDELRETADSVILNLTLYEVGATISYTPPPPLDDGGGGGGDEEDGLFWWYDAQNMGVFADGAPVPTWIDQSGGSRHATADTGLSAYQPSYDASAINGHPAVVFQYGSGNGRGYSMPGTFLPTEAHLFIVSKVSADSPPYHLGPQGGGQNPQFPATSGAASISDHFGSSVQRTVGAAGVDTTAGFIYHAHAKAALWESHVGLTAKFSSVTNTVYWNGQKLGAWWYGGFYVYMFQGSIGEFKVYKGPRTSLEVSSEITALGTKWGITP